MKKIIKAVALSMVLLVATLSFAGCGFFNGSSSGAKFSSLQEYIDNPEMQKTISDTMESVADILELKCYADGDTLIYEYKYKTLIPESMIETAAASIKESLDDQKSSMKGLFEQIESVVNVENLVVCYRYMNADDTLITEVFLNKSDFE